MARRKKKFQGIIAVSPTGFSYLVTKQGAKWYMMGMAVDKNMTLPLTMSTSKARLLRYVRKQMGFVVV